jgi:hypothetical protein
LAKLANASQQIENKRKEGRKEGEEISEGERRGRGAG